MTDQPLSFTDFDSITAEQWESKIALDLKGKSSEKMGLPLGSEQFMPIAISSHQDIPTGNIPQFGKFPLLTAAPSPLDNPTLLEALMGGVNSLLIDQQEMKEDSWSLLMDQVDLSFLDITLDAKLVNQQFFFKYLQEADKKCLSGENIGCSVAEELALFQEYYSAESAWRFFSCHPKANALEPAIEIADFITTANARLEELDKTGQQNQGATAFSCRLTIGTNYMQTIMKIRAVRLVWALLLDAWKLDAQIPIFIHSIADESIFGDSDIEKTMIRSTSLAAAALVGGANAIWIKPMYTGAAKGDFYQRIARNNLHLFEQEGKMGWVNDPVAGAKYFEHGANLIAEQAWDLFRAS